MPYRPSSRPQKLQAELIHLVFRMLADAGGELPAEELLAGVPSRISLVRLPALPYRSAERPRLQALIEEVGSVCEDLGLLRKSSSVWKLTPAGMRASRLSKADLYGFIQAQLKRSRLGASPTSVPQAARTSAIRTKPYIRSREKWGGSFRSDPQGPRTGPAIARSKYHLREVLFATNRTMSLEDGRPTFARKRAAVTHYGKCLVSVPYSHAIGAIERPFLRLKLLENPAKHMIVLEVETSTKDQFIAEVASRVAASAKKQAFVFVHGFNVSFENAALRTAQMSYDLKFKGAPVFFSWPSAGVETLYTHDETAIEWATADIKTFIKDFAEESGAENIYLIGHSMGNRGLTRALQDLIVEAPEVLKRISEIILTAPDIDAQVFTEQIAPKLALAERPVTLYASSDDRALFLSKKFHGFRRAGDANDGIVVAPGVETIDATGMDTSFLGHSYYGSTRTVLADIFVLIEDGKRAAHRFGLREVRMEGDRLYWKFEPSKPGGFLL